MMKLKTLAAIAIAVPLTVVFAQRSYGQAQTETPAVVPGAKAMIVEHIKVHGKALEGNLEGEAVDRDVVVFLPPSYNTDKTRRYPVVYALHGYSIGAEQWTHEIHVPQTIEGAFAQGSKEMIVVLPDSKTIYNGSMYSSSATTGDFEKFISHDLVEYIDAHYRTIADRQSRGLAGHSMGGYGTTRIGMKHPEVFGAMYIMSACCLSPRTLGGGRPPAAAGAAHPPAGAAPAGAPAQMPDMNKALEEIKTPADAAKAPFLSAQLAVAAAWSPNPKNPPMYIDLPTKNGEPQADVLAKWTANAPLAFVDQYIDNLRQYRAIGMDVGDQDGGKVDLNKLHEILDGYGVPNQFELYQGTHTSRVAFRFQEHVIPFFSKNLCFTKECR